jgi:hypothetical protein
LQKYEKKRKGGLTKGREYDRISTLDALKAKVAEKWFEREPTGNFAGVCPC